MKKKGETKKGSDEFRRFEDFARKLVSVPKDEILRREQAEKDRKQAGGKTKII